MAGDSDSKLFSWLAEQADLGLHHSGGQFTIDSAAAWEKLAAFSLPFEHAWVLKLVQSAVRARVSLRVTQSRVETTFEWGLDWECLPQELDSAMLSLDGNQNSAHAHLGLGIRALAKTTKLPFAITYTNGKKAIWNGSAFQSLAECGPAAAFRVTVGHFEKEQTSWLLSHDSGDARRRSAAIAKALTSHCQWSPSEVRLDGRSIGNIFLDPEFGPSTFCQPLLYLRAHPVAEHPSLRVPASLDRSDVENNIVETSVPLDKELSQPSLAVGLVSVFLTKTGPEYKVGSHAHQLAWVVDGVEVAREQLNFQPGPVALLLACSAEGLETDLSGLTPRRNEAWAERRRAAIAAIAAVASAQVKSQKKTSRKVKAKAEVSRPLYWGLAALGGLICVLAPNVLVLPAVVWVSHLYGRDREDKLKEPVAAGLRDLLRELAGEPEETTKDQECPLPPLRRQR